MVARVYLRLMARGCLRTRQKTTKHSVVMTKICQRMMARSYRRGY
jgi:hypothetical protein